MTNSKQKQNRNKSDKKKEVDVRKPYEYAMFIKWIAMPLVLRSPRFQKNISEEYKIDEDTLTNWKKRKGYKDDVTEEMKKHFNEKTPNVIQALYQQALKDGKASEVKLWLQYLEGWVPKEGIEHNDRTLEDLLKEDDDKNKQKDNRRAVKDSGQTGSKPKVHLKPDTKVLPGKKDIKGSDPKGKAEGV
ncbi:hypothetical protein LCGC14_1469920 [marine sediment metagenome]|uniref:Homeodomain phBC6A51-type domain-containing protein n=1 Tax=marine sediment metagenome TaxID=412755 RepID=A0A0F9JYL1_9ZZZZ